MNKDLEIKILGNSYKFNVNIKDEKDLERIINIIEDTCKYVQQEYSKLPREKKVALIIIFLAHQALQKEKKIEKLKRKIEDYETALKYVEKMDES
jgi:cell division protein ZapA (FtsZ GTPase activity inhibitor)